MIRVNKLRNLLRQWRAGLISAEEVQNGFQNVLEKSIAFTNEFNLYRDELRAYDWKNMKAYQQKNILAAKAMEKASRSSYKEAIRHISEAKKIRHKIIEVIHTINTLKEGKAMLQSIEANINSRWLKRMPSIILLYRYLEIAEELMRSQKFREAKVLINSCIIDIKHGKDNTSSETSDSIERLNHLIKISKDTAKWSVYCSTPQLILEGKVEYLIKELIETNKVKFADRILNDISYVIRDRIAFFELINAYGEPDLSLNNILKNTIQKGDWIEGGNYLLKIKIMAQKSNINLT